MEHPAWCPRDDCESHSHRSRPALLGAVPPGNLHVAVYLNKGPRAEGYPPANVVLVENLRISAYSMIRTVGLMMAYRPAHRVSRYVWYGAEHQQAAGTQASGAPQLS